MKSQIDMRRYTCTLFVLMLICVHVTFAQTTDARDARGAQVRRQQFDAFQQEPRIAVIVAVDQYPEESGFRKLDFAGKDADALAETLAGPDFNYKVQKLINQRALRNVVRQTLRNAAAMVNGKGTLIFFFAGHGGQKDGKQYLATYETGAERLDEFGLPLSEVRELLNSAKAPRKIMIVDACRNDPTAAGSRGLDKQVGRFGRLEESMGLRILNATGPQQVSYEDPKLGHGIFSYFLLKGLAGDAADAGGLVTFRGLADYVSREVSDFSFSSNRQQMPYEAGDAYGDFLLGGKLKAPAPAPVVRTTAAPAADVDAWEAIRGSNNAQLFEQFLKEYPASQYAGAARLKISALRPSDTPPASSTVGRKVEILDKHDLPESSSPPTKSAGPAVPPRISVGGAVQAAKLVSQPRPVYPALAKQARIQGTVRLNALIAKDGTIENLEVVSGHPILVPAALAAVKQWVYKPTLLNGEPVAVATIIDVNFTLSSHTEIPVDPKVFDGYVGRYQLTASLTVTVTREGDALFAQLTGQSKFQIFPESDKTYFYKVVDAQIIFDTDAQGRATALVLHQNGTDQQAKRIQ